MGLGDKDKATVPVDLAGGGKAGGKKRSRMAGRRAEWPPEHPRVMLTKACAINATPWRAKEHLRHTCEAREGQRAR